MTEQTNETALPQEKSNVQEAQALTEMRSRVNMLEAQNADLQAAKKQYYDTILNGSLPVEESAPKTRSIKEIREDLIKVQEAGCSNLDYAKIVVELNDAVVEATGQSCFLPVGKDVTVTMDEKELADRFPRILKECIEEADGDPDIFNNELKRHMKK